MAKSLYTVKDVKEVREELFKRQNGKCALTGIDITTKESVLDHDHSTQYVRSVLHRQSNAVLGKIENLYNRYLGWWFKGTLSDFLRLTADYLDSIHLQEFVHPAWIKKVQTEFNKLKAIEQISLLKLMQPDTGYIHSPGQSNTTTRKLLFKKILLLKQHDYVTIVSMIQQVKGNQ